MVSYLNRLECLIEKWQSRRKTIEISQAIKSETKRASPTVEPRAARIRVDGYSSCNTRPISSSSDDRQLPPSPTLNKENNCVIRIESTTFGADLQPLAANTKESNVNDGLQNSSHSSMEHLDTPGGILGPTTDTAKTTTETIIKRPQHQISNNNHFIYVLSVFMLLVGSLNHFEQSHPITAAMAARPTINRGPSAAAAAATTSSLLSASFRKARQFGELHLSNLIQQLAAPSTRSRWIQIPGPQTSIRDPPQRRRQTYLSRALSRLSNQIGARNTIRVHNAFRDFAWRLLASLNMPTPVIYELRRQHLYSPEDDSMNDSYSNKNTTRTIRSKRQLLKFWPAIERRWAQADSEAGGLHFGPRAKDDDDDEPDSLRGRLRLRLEDLANLSSRSLFGRVIRVPALFPFKRQEDNDDSKDDSDTTGGGRRRARRRRRKKEADRQMISINGKQYYVNDEGELKELKDDRSEP